jgi:hypothetical protein
MSTIRILAASVLVASALPAQIIRGPARSTSTPGAFVALSIGWAQTGGICDAPTDACWNFQGAPQWRGTLDVPMGRGAAFGVTGTTSRVEVDYQGNGITECQCTAHANVSQLLGSFRIGGGNEIGFHQVIEVAGGAIFFTNFRDASGTRLGATTTTDPAFSLGYGFGYGFGQHAEVTLMQDYGLIIHQHHMAGSNNSAQQYTTRIGMRFGLGGH